MEALSPAPAAAPVQPSPGPTRAAPAVRGRSGGGPAPGHHPAPPAAPRRPPPRRSSAPCPPGAPVLHPGFSARSCTEPRGEGAAPGVRLRRLRYRLRRGQARDRAPEGRVPRRGRGAGSPLPGTALTPFPPRLFAGSRDAPAPLRPGEGGQDAAPEPGGAPQCPCSPAPPGPGPSPGPERLQARRQLSIACTVCCVFMVGEVIGGYLAHSLAIMTDAAHLLTDVGSMSVSLFSLWVSARPPTKTMSFGWHRSGEAGGSALGEPRGWARSAPRSMAYILHQAPAIHGHGTGGYEQLESAGGCLPGHAPLPGSTSVRAAFVHVVGDLLQSIGVLVAATIIYFKPQCKIADPISTLFFSVFVLGSTLTILRDVFRVLMEGAPRGIEFNAVKEVLLAVSGVRGTHDLHIWALTLSHPVVSVHVAVDASANPETVLREATSQLQSKFGFVSCTVQVERYQEEALGCPHCQDPRA
uniref:Probable proton-coupled zinc antiporter SLC30A3 n=1 Tax=Anas zonorhyncha TaxID=75864 RepID=A0A8B9VWS5_9AVES